MQIKQVKKLSKLDLRKIQANKLKQILVDEEAEKSKMIKFLYACSTAYNDKLLDFMDEYHLDNLCCATFAQLKEYVAKHNLRKIDNGKSL